MSRESLFELPSKDYGWVEPLSKAKIAKCNYSQSPQCIFELINGSAIEHIINDTNLDFNPRLPLGSETVVTSKRRPADYIFDSNRVRISQLQELVRNFPDFVFAPEPMERQESSVDDQNGVVIPFPKLYLVK